MSHIAETCATSDRSAPLILHLINRKFSTLKISKTSKNKKSTNSKIEKIRTMVLYQTGSQIFAFSQTRIIEELGIALEPMNNYHFYDDHLPTPFIRSYAEPCGTLNEDPPTKFCNGTSFYYRMENLKNLHENCNEKWNKTIKELHEFANPPAESSRTRRSIIGAASVFVKTIGKILH